MRPSIYWLDLGAPSRLAIMPRPRAGDWLADEVAGWKAEGIDIVVSLLEPDEAAELDLRDVPVLCSGAGIQHVSFPIADRGVPASIAETDCLVRRLSDALAACKAVAVHCRAGIGRSALIAACVLVRNGYDVDAAFATIAKARGVVVPDTEAQRPGKGVGSALRLTQPTKDGGSNHGPTRRIPYHRDGRHRPGAVCGDAAG